MYHMATDLAWNLPGNIMYESIHRRGKEEHKLKRKGNKQIYWNDNSSKHKKTFRISPGKGKTSYRLLTSRLQNSRFFPQNQ